MRIVALIALITLGFLLAGCAASPAASPVAAPSALTTVPDTASRGTTPPPTNVHELRSTVVAVETMANLIFVPATLNRSEPVTLLLDTGASYTLISLEAARRLGLAPEAAREWRAVVVPGGRELRIPVIPIGSLGVGAAVLEGLEIGIYDVFPDSSRLDGVLGGDFLRRFRLTVDHGSRMIDLQPLAPARSSATPRGR
jgi:hypothetical protein